ncbi:hypothetical protein FOCC_FOCC002524, partial [Frankliniella occidentalis]
MQSQFGVVVFHVVFPCHSRAGALHGTAAACASVLQCRVASVQCPLPWNSSRVQSKRRETSRAAADTPRGVEVHVDDDEKRRGAQQQQQRGGGIINSASSAEQRVGQGRQAPLRPAMKGKPAPAAGPAATTEQLLEQPPLCLTRHIKKEPSDEEIKDYAETAMNELLSWYGYDKLDRREAQNLSLRGGPGATLGALGPLHRLPPHLASALASAAKAAAAAAVDP